MTVAQRLCDSGHYAAPSIRLQANKLDRDWQTFAAAIEERSTILALSVVFHKKASEVTAAYYSCLHVSVVMKVYKYDGYIHFQYF